MDKSLVALCDAVKTIIQQLKPKSNALSYLLLIGQSDQGKKSLLRQSNLKQYNVETERNIDIYYNHSGLIVHLDTTWLSDSNCLLNQVLKQLNRCHHSLKISGILFCIDINDFFLSEHFQFMERSQTHLKLLRCFGEALGYRVDLAIMLTKLDSLSGFCEFFQQSHASELEKPLGFSIHPVNTPEKLLVLYNRQFDHMINLLEQQVIAKLHPVRSSLRRTLIREFPLQLTSLQRAIQTLLQHIPLNLFNLQTIYFSSAEQGGYTKDRLNEKIKHEYALTIQDQFIQAKNYRAYFINGAIMAFQEQTQQAPKPRLKNPKWVIASSCGLFVMPLFWLTYHHMKTSHLMDEASQELVTYEVLSTGNADRSPAVFHLNKASDSFERLTTRSSLPTLQYIKTHLQANAKHHLQADFLPNVLTALENCLNDAKKSPGERYQALKIYLMLNTPQHFALKPVTLWFKQYWQQAPAKDVQKKLSLLRQLLNQPLQPIAINQQLVQDTRNYLNALPKAYLYYSQAKTFFPAEKDMMAIDGLVLPYQERPVYFTKSGFNTVSHMLPEISAQLKDEQWVLARHDNDDILAAIYQAYSYEYISWWKNLINRTTLLHFDSYQKARQLTTQLQQTNALNQFIDMVQQHTSPDFSNQESQFNRKIATQFTDINLLSNSSLHELSGNLNELENFLKTLAVVQDNGQTAFTLTRAHFIGHIPPNPINALYSRSEQFPQPVKGWFKQIADDAWFILMQETRAYINAQWQQQIFNPYSQQIAQRFPFAPSATEEVNIKDFEQFFAFNGRLNQFVEYYIKPYLDTSSSDWRPKEYNHYVLPVTQDSINELIRANIISNMFFTPLGKNSQIEFSLQKISLDPMVAHFQFQLGNHKIQDDQYSNSFARFTWPAHDAKLVLNSIEGGQFVLEENGDWALFKLLQKVNVLTDEKDSSTLQILFEINGNSGRYLLKTANKVNPFTPGILNGFTLPETIA